MLPLAVELFNPGTTSRLPMPHHRAIPAASAPLVRKKVDQKHESSPSMRTGC